MDSQRTHHAAAGALDERAGMIKAVRHPGLEPMGDKGGARRPGLDPGTILPRRPMYSELEKWILDRALVGLSRMTCSMTYCEH